MMMNKTLKRPKANPIKSTQKNTNQRSQMYQGISLG